MLLSLEPRWELASMHIVLVDLYLFYTRQRYNTYCDSSVIHMIIKTNPESYCIVSDS